MWLDRAIKWLLPREDHFFDLLDRGADTMVHAGTLVEQCIKAPTLEARQPIIQQMEDAEHAADRVISDVYEALNRTFVTPLDRSDIYALATGLENVVDCMHACTMYIRTHNMEALPNGAQELAVQIRECSSQLGQSVKLMRQLREHATVREHCNHAHRIEHDADVVFRTNTAALFKQEKDAIRLMIFKEFLEELEHTTDILDDLANAIENVLIKNA
jgi:uncharacterized protein Yka (UPF0111/DUF47 family)